MKKDSNDSSSRMKMSSGGGRRKKKGDHSYIIAANMLYNTVGHEWWVALQMILSAQISPRKARQGSVAWKCVKAFFYFWLNMYIKTQMRNVCWVHIC